MEKPPKNYTNEMTKELVEAYLASDKDYSVVELYSEKWDKSSKSIIGKLSKEGIYAKKEYTTKVGERPVTKKEMVFNVANLLGVDPDKIQTLEKMSKIELVFLISNIEKINS